MRPYDVAVVGAGVIGQSIAWQCARRGLRVLVLDPAPGQGASRVAAGMLAPVAEASFGEQELTTLQVASLHRWPSFAAELTAASRLDIGYRTDGTLLIGLTHDDLQAVQRLQTYRQDLGLITQPVTGQAAREQEPLLNPRVCGGTRAPGDHQVDPRRLLRALTTALNDLDVEIVTRSVTDPRSVDAPVVVIAAGCASAAIAGQPVRPVKGQVLRLRAGDRHPVLRGTVRGWADGRSVYLVPRADGDLIVGATAEERRDRTATAGAVLDLLRAATDLVPAVSEYELVEVSVGHRPATPDNAPLIGPLASGPGKRLIAATGHYRNGILLAPVTADAVAELVVTGETPEVIAAFGVDRRPWTPVHGHAEDAGTHPGSSAWT